MYYYLIYLYDYITFHYDTHYIYIYIYPHLPLPHPHLLTQLTNSSRTRRGCAPPLRTPNYCILYTRPSFPRSQLPNNDPAAADTCCTRVPRTCSAQLLYTLYTIHYYIYIYIYALLKICNCITFIF